MFVRSGWLTVLFKTLVPVHLLQIILSIVKVGYQCLQILNCLFLTLSTSIFTSFYFGILNAPAVSLQFCLSLHFLLVQSHSQPQVSCRLGPFRFFLGTCTVLYTYMSESSRNMLELLQACTPADLPFSSFPFKCFGESLIHPSGSTVSGTCKIKHLGWLFSTNALEILLFAKSKL